MPISTRKAQPRLAFIPQSFNPLVLQAAQWSLPLLLRFRTRPWLPAGIVRVETTNVEVLVDLYRQFQAGQIRFLMAFRHCEVDDPLCMFHLLSRDVPRAARQQGIKLHSPIHTHFIYERGMPLWAGAWLGWLFSRLGGIPIHRGRRLDRIGIRTARDLFANGKLPMTVAPEGATNGHSEIVSPLEPGVAQLGFWCVEDLMKTNRSEAVFIVPIGIQYRYVNSPWAELDKLLNQLEMESGLPVQPVTTTATQDRTNAYYQRLLRLSEHLLNRMEQFYRQYYHQPLPQFVSSSVDNSSLGSTGPLLAARLQTLLNVALQIPEEYFGLPSWGTLIERCRRVEEVGWKHIYREDLPDLDTLSPLERGLADWIAEEAELRMRHMRLVESFVAVTGGYVREKPSIERFAETALILFDALARIKGQKLPHRPRLGWRWAQMTIGKPISVTERWPIYQTDRRAARQAVADLTQDLQTALEKMIV